MIIIDTHILLWWQLSDDSLNITYRERLERPNEIIGISTVSLMEIICLYDRQRINLPIIPELWIEQIMADSKIVFIPISASIAIDAFRLPEPFHKDPADRLIVSSARVLNCPIMTQDYKILAYSHVQNIDI
ncbi:MAG: type II toxin-antitoxin system VapC family toxin [Microcystaceae cyanobacterium]